MFKKFLIVAALAIGLFYFTGNDLDTLHRQITGGANENARGLTAGSDQGWGSDSGY